jgi:hypothetical protein
MGTAKFGLWGIFGFNPDSSRILTISVAQAGVNSEGLKITGQPAAKATGTLCIN